jgi:hypothetical protein
MNLDHITKIWNDFSKLKEVELKHKERTIQDSTQSNYLINYTDEVATFSFIGMLSKSNKGENTDKTSVIVEYKNRLSIPNFEFIKSTDCGSDFEKNILKLINQFNGNSITLRDEFIRIDTEHIFSSINEFELVTDLISELKKTQITI